MDRVHNAIWRVIGEDRREWVLKQLPEFPPGVGPVEEYRVLCYLQAAGLPVPVPIVTDDGQIAHNADNLRTDPQTKQPTGTRRTRCSPCCPTTPSCTSPRGSPTRSAPASPDSTEHSPNAPGS